jgi:hypothetical protein
MVLAFLQMQKSTMRENRVVGAHRDRAKGCDGHMSSQTADVVSSRPLTG